MHDRPDCTESPKLMAPDVIQEIPPAETSPAKPNKWTFLLGLAVLVMAGAAFVALTRPALPALQWARFTTPPGQVNFDSMVATDKGVALLSGITEQGILLWSQDAAGQWRSQPLAEPASQLAGVEGSLIAYRTREGRVIVAGPTGWTETTPWAFPEELRSRQASGRPSVIGNEDGLLVVTLAGEVWWSDQGGEFVKVIPDPEWGPGVEQPFDPTCLPPSTSSPDVPPIVVTSDGFLALVSTHPLEPFGIWPVCEPRIWVSEDGRAWDETESVIGDGAFVYDMAWRGGRFIAVGGRGIGDPSAWTSDDGLEWQTMTFFDEKVAADLFSIEAGPAGWVVLGQDTEDHDFVGWTSTDGECWEPLPEDVRGASAAVSEEQIVVLERGPLPGLWVGSLTGETGECE